MHIIYDIKNKIASELAGIGFWVLASEGIYTFGPNLVALAWTGDELLLGQAQNGVNFDFEVKFDLESLSQSTPKTIGILSNIFYAYGPNLVILAWTGDELSRGQTWWRTDRRTDWPTDRRRQRQYPKANTGLG